MQIQPRLQDGCTGWCQEALHGHLLGLPQVHNGDGNIKYPEQASPH